MALFNIKSLAALDNSYVLAPERYDPRRDSLNKNGRHTETTTIGNIVNLVRHSLNPSTKKVSGQTCVVLDTCDAREGIIIGRKKAIEIKSLGSQKKRFECGDLLISRLRPYLRQVAFADAAFAESSGSLQLACSTEFYVLRSVSHQSIAFLVPYLLSEPIQSVLAASQEGGHHPRFDDKALLKLPVPSYLMQHRTRLSSSVEQSIDFYRKSEHVMTKTIEESHAVIEASSID